MAVNQAIALIRKHILEGTVWNHPDYEDSIEGLAQAFQGADRADMVAASAELLLDPDVRIRSGIATVLRDFILEIEKTPLDVIYRNSSLLILIIS